jgi:hypothetical protein
MVPKHYDAKHRFECVDSDCEDEFTTEGARDEVQPFCWLSVDQVLIVHRSPQHYNEVHRTIECPACEREFETQKAMDQVRTQPSIR